MKFSDLTAYADRKILAGILDNTGYLVINNPERHNAVSLAMYEAAAEIVEAMADDDEARLLVIRGAGGKAFASGADISKFESERSSEEQVAIYSAASARFYNAVVAFPPVSSQLRKPMIWGWSTVLCLPICWMPILQIT